MAFTTPPVFTRPQGDPASMREVAGLFRTIAETFERQGQEGDRLADKGGDLYWDNAPGDVFWGGVAQRNYIDAAVKRLRLLGLAGTTFRAAGEVLAATAEHLAIAQAGVDQAQSVATQRASADAVNPSPVPLTFEQEQQVAATSTALAAGSASEAAAKIRALSAVTPGYTAPALAPAGAVGPLAGGATLSGGAATVTAGASTGPGAATSGAAATSGSGSTTPVHGSTADDGTAADGAGRRAGAGPTGSGASVGGGTSAARAVRSTDDEDDPAVAGEEA
jgi:hypothetical protein